ncbi:type I-E CRISPR-associated protein Cse1/CasA [Micromonospora haikouensis]|uniref:type I-E CRISPR-associated protein Cse1/CasA n=1 Tax=Micromonospora haikouensis TaxID=686309 RepID=UPI003D7326C3
MPAYNLVDAPWIPVLAIDGTREEVGLRDALTRAHQITPLPPNQEGVALLRLLLTAYDAAAGPATDAEWDTAWQADTLDAERINTYLDTWQHRFDLYHPERPAFQCGHIGAYNRGPEVLHPAYLGGDGGAFFNPQLAAGRPVPAAQAARWLLVLAGYDVAGIKAAPGGGRSYGAHVGPIAAVTHLHLTGRTLKDTLLLNLPPQPRQAGDTPAWERDCPELGTTEREPTGRLDWLTWTGRRIRLAPDSAGHVTAVAWHDGDRVPGGAWGAAHTHDPVTAWSRDRNGNPMPLRVADDNSNGPHPWIGAHLLGGETDAAPAPAECEAFHHVVQAARRGTLPSTYRLAAVVGTVIHGTRHRSTIADAPVNALPIGTVWALADATMVTELRAARTYAIGRVTKLAWAVQTFAARPAFRPEVDFGAPWRQLLADLDESNPEAAHRWRSAVDDIVARVADTLGLPILTRAKVMAVCALDQDLQGERG